MAVSSSTTVTEVELDEEFVPGAKLEEPLEGRTVEALRMWLICHAIDVSASLKKAQLIADRGVNLALWR